MKRGVADIAADVVLALAKADLTLSAVSGEVFDDRGKTTIVRKYVEALKSVGMVRVAAWRWYAQDWIPMYRLNDAPFSKPDVPKPQDVKR